MKKKTADNTPLDDEERELFNNAMRDVQPIRQDKRQGLVRPRVRIPKPAEEATSIDVTYSDSEANIEAGDVIEYNRQGLQHRVIQKLRRGKFTISARIDLHGMTKTEALQELKQFLQHKRTAGMGCVLVIHGKGQGSGRTPVLKNLLNHWLPHQEEVLAFCSARREHGGTGALYLLLKAQPGKN